VKREEFATVDLTLGTPIPESPIPGSPRALDLPENYSEIEEEGDLGSK
jgi:hypothetical protein